MAGRSENTTGPFTVIDDGENGVGHSCGGCRYKEPETGLWGLSRDTWTKLIVWLVPIVFTSGALFYNFRDMDEQVGEHSSVIKGFSDVHQEFKTEQTVQATKLEAIKQKQVELDRKVDKLDDKLDGQNDDLAAIKAKLGVKGSRRRRM